MKNNLISQLSSESTSPCTGRREQREAANLNRVELMFPPPDPLHKMPPSMLRHLLNSSHHPADCLTLKSSSKGIDSHFLFTSHSAPLQQSDFYSPLLRPLQSSPLEVLHRSPQHYAALKALLNLT